MYRSVAASALLLLGCKGKAAEETKQPDRGSAAVGRDAGVDSASTMDAGVWPELAPYRQATPIRVIALPARADVPRYEVGGPAIAGDVAVVASSQFGFMAVDWRRGHIAWNKPAGSHVAPPLATADHVILVGDCVAPPDVPQTQRLLGCLRVVSHAGADLAYIAIRGAGPDIDAFLAEPGAQAVWGDGERAIRWRRGERAVKVDLVSGVAKPANATPPPLVAEYKGRRWDIEHLDGRLVAKQAGKVAWSTKHEYTAMLGIVWTGDREPFPLVRIANIGAFAGEPEVHLHDIDATGSLRAQFARPVPGISLLGFGTSSAGDVALAVRMDRSIQRDFVVGYHANAFLMWVYPLPEIPRADPVGVAVVPEAVVVFHDGDTFTVLPDLSTLPTPAAGSGSASNSATP